MQNLFRYTSKPNLGYQAQPEKKVPKRGGWLQKAGNPTVEDKWKFMKIHETDPSNLEKHKSIGLFVSILYIFWNGESVKQLTLLRSWSPPWYDIKQPRGSHHPRCISKPPLALTHHDGTTLFDSDQSNSVTATAFKVRFVFFFGEKGTVKGLVCGGWNAVILGRFVRFPEGKGGKTYKN